MSEVNNDKVEVLLNEIKEQLDNEATASEVIAKSADSLVAAQVEKFDLLSKAVDGIVSTLATITKAIEELNIPTREDLDAHIEEKAQEIVKSLDEKVETIEEKIEKTVEDAAAQNEELKKTIETLENEPVVKSIADIDEPTVAVKEEVVVETAPSRGELINKALEEIKTADHQRSTELFRAITLLEAGASLDTIKL